MEILKMDLDIRDFEKVSDIVSKRCGAVLNILKIKPNAVTVRSTARGYHIFLEIEGEYTSFDLCFLQMALGSDYKREVFNYMRFKNSLSKDWNLLFSKKVDEKGNILSVEKEEPELSSRLWARIKERVGC